MTVPTPRTKIVATLGPASADDTVLSDMVDAGLDVARINFSHGTHESNGALIARVRRVAHRCRANIAIMADLQGPRVRTVVAETLTLAQGSIIRIVGVTASASVPTKIDKIPVLGMDQSVVVAALRPGHRIYIEDGLKQLTVADVRDDGTVLASVDVGGPVATHKGLNFPDTDMPLPPLTVKDRADLTYLLSPSVVEDIDYIALSFVRRATDITALRDRIAQMVPEAKMRPRIVVKVERPEALSDLDAIVAAADAVMVARGDLATEAGQERVGVLTKDIITTALRHLRPVIVATQMLASMETSPRPTRAEIADVTNAVTDHTDATMLSGETANGTYPAASVATMNAIIHAAEISPYDDVTEEIPADGDVHVLERARRTVLHAQAIEADAIIVATADGEEAIAVSHYRDGRRIIALTPDVRVQRRLALVWGVEAYLDRRALTRDPHDLLDHAAHHAGTRTAALYH